MWFSLLILPIYTHCQIPTWIELKIMKGVSNFNLSDIDLLYKYNNSRGWSEIHVTLLMTKIKWSEIKWCHIWHNNRILMQLK